MKMVSLQRVRNVTRLRINSGLTVGVTSVLHLDRWEVRLLCLGQCALMTFHPLCFMKVFLSLDMREFSS